MVDFLLAIPGLDIHRCLTKSPHILGEARRQPRRQPRHRSLLGGCLCAGRACARAAEWRGLGGGAPPPALGLPATPAAAAWRAPCLPSA